MKTLLAILCIMIMATAAWGTKPPGISNGTPTRVECEFTYVAWTWDFAEGDNGFTTAMCDAEGLPTWAWGEESTEFGPQNVWATVLNGDYESDTGEALISPIWTVDASNYLVQVHHWYEIENSYDGGNLMVNGVVVPPFEGYPDDEISDSANYYAWCVDLQPGFTDDELTEFITSCFDLSQFMGEEVQLEFQFGSDSSVVRAGWYLGSIAVGGDVVANEAATWSQLKATYK